MEPRILFFDIEISPNLGYVWQKYETNVIKFHSEFQILSFACKWLGEKFIHCYSMEGEKSDKKLVERLKKFLDQADVVVAHNGKRFDVKKFNARLAYHKLQPAKPYPVVDTKEVAKRYFAFNSNSLDDLGHYLGIGRKVKHEGIDLWLKCMANNAAAWKRIRAYNKQDVVLLERVYKRFLPYIQNHPNLAKIKDNPGCPNCGSMHVIKSGIRANASGIRQQMQCKTCHTWFLTRYKKT